jgi:hypothetical protein
VGGLSQVIFRREPDGGRRVLSIDELLAHLDDWERVEPAVTPPRGRPRP